MNHGFVRVYYANQLIITSSVRQNETVRFQGLPPDVYNGGYIKYPEGHNFYPASWARCDGTPVLLEDVPKELLLIELLNPPT
jgi:hypothetical protein